MSSPIVAAIWRPTRCRRRCASSTLCRNPTWARSCARICAIFLEAIIMALAGYGMATAAEFVGRELGVSDWVVVDQDRIDAFAECTGDRQWIHIDVERARRESPFWRSDCPRLPDAVAGCGYRDGDRHHSSG